MTFLIEHENVFADFRNAGKTLLDRITGTLTSRWMLITSHVVQVGSPGGWEATSTSSNPSGSDCGWHGLPHATSMDAIRRPRGRQEVVAASVGRSATVSACE